MKNFFRTYKVACFSENNWKIIKVIFSIFLVLNFINILFLGDNHIITPMGACKILPCNFVEYTFIKVILFFVVFSSVCFYICERNMVSALTILFFTTWIVFSISDSYGVLNRLQGMLIIIIAQLIIYILTHFEKLNMPLNNARILMSSAFVSVLYTLGGISKILYSEKLWFLNYDGFAVQCYKSHLYNYVTNGNIIFLERANLYFDLILSFPLVFMSLLFLSFLLELFCFVTIISRKISLIWGIGLLGMHIGIYILMDINIAVIFLPMALFILNFTALFFAIKKHFIK